MSLRIYGKLPKGERLKKIQASVNYQKGSFQNLSLTNAMAEDADFFKLLKGFVNKPKSIRPLSPLPHVKTNLKEMSSEIPQLVWFGHSSYFLKLKHRNILVDPVFSGNAAPMSFMIQAFKGSDVYQTTDFPEIDLLILTHDHYDHLDYKTLVKLKPKIRKIVCALGVGSHLEYWGYNKRIIHELDWWEQMEEDDLHITAAPARHFSGRGVKRGQSLWSSFILKTPELSLYLGGDSGYDEHFKLIGKEFGSFDLAVLECGQYNTMWPHIHMMPEETVKAAGDLNARVVLPVHWAKFALALHPWNESIKRFVAEAKKHEQVYCTPKIGECINLRAMHPNEECWHF